MKVLLHQVNTVYTCSVFISGRDMVVTIVIIMLVLTDVFENV